MQGSIRDAGAPRQREKYRRKRGACDASTFYKTNDGIIIIPQIQYVGEGVKQACAQSMCDLARDVYLEPPKDMGMPSNKMIKAVKPHYGIAEAGVCWWIAFSKCHKEDLAMRQAAMGPYLFFKKQTELYQASKSL